MAYEFRKGRIDALQLTHIIKGLASCIYAHNDRLIILSLVRIIVCGVSRLGSTSMEQLSVQKALSLSQTLCRISDCPSDVYIYPRVVC